jgi:predicted house-cleaning noncanonical NTP pyrophosphatase (MazG superfamily)
LIERYDKLVRDKIPDVIRLKGDTPSVVTLGDEQYFHALNKKISEEVAEYLEDYSVDELADIVEVVYALVKYKGLSLHEFEQIRLKKREERGGFDNKISLVEVKYN